MYQQENGLFERTPAAAKLIPQSFTPFGLKGLQADFYRFRVASSGHFADSLDLSPPDSLDMVVFQEALSFSSLVPSLENTFMDIVKLHRVIIKFYKGNSTEGPPRGWSLAAQLRFDSAYGEIHTLLSDLFKDPEPVLDISCSLGQQRGWTSPLRLDNFTLEGVFHTRKASPVEGVHLAKIGLRISGSPRSGYDRNGQLSCHVSYQLSLFGMLEFNFSAWQCPAALSFTLSKWDTMYSLSSFLDIEWNNAFGVNGLKLMGVGFNANLDGKNPWKSLSFDVSATWNLEKTAFHISGAFDTAGHFDVSTTIYNLNWNTLAHIYKTFFDDELKPPEFEFSIQLVILRISRTDGIQLVINGAQFGKYACGSGLILITSSKLTIKAQLHDGNISLPFDMNLQSAFVDISISKESASLMLGGVIHVSGYEISAAVHLYTVSNDNSLRYTILGTFATEEGKGFRLSDHVQGMEDSILKDITLDKLAMLIASHDDSELATAMKCPYEFKNGIQICAAVGGLSQVNKLLETHNQGPEQKTSGLVLKMHKPFNSRDFEIAIDCGGPRFHLGHGIYTEGLALKILLRTRPALTFVGKASVVPHGSKEKLEFTVGLTVDPIILSVQGSMKGYWQNPLQLCDKLKIGPELALQLDFSYVNGPAGLGFIGGLEFGKIVGQVGFKISQIPTDQYFHVYCEAIDMHDIAALGSLIAGRALPQPDNFLKLAKLKIYACPAGVMVAERMRPQGFSFYCDVSLWGTRVLIDAELSNTGIKMLGVIQPFKIGQWLTVTGVGAGPAIFDLQLSQSSQYILVTAQAVLCDNIISLYLKTSLKPIAFEFAFSLVLSEAFSFRATAIPDKTTLKEGQSPFNAKYTITTEFSAAQKAAIGKQLCQLFEAAKKSDGDFVALMGFIADQCVDGGSHHGKLVEYVKQQARASRNEKIDNTKEYLTRNGVLDALDLIQVDKVDIKAEMDVQATSLVFNGSIEGHFAGDRFWYPISVKAGGVDSALGKIVQDLKRDFATAFKEAEEAWNLAKIAAAPVIAPVVTLLDVRAELNRLVKAKDKDGLMRLLRDNPNHTREILVAINEMNSAMNVIEGTLFGSFGRWG